jgi:hypothetical protein
MCLMNNDFNQYLDKFVLDLLDDILMYSKNEVENEEHLILVLQVLREHQLYAMLNKCNFFQRRVQYLGHIIFEEGIIVDPKNNVVIMEWPTPKDFSDVRYFMGLEGHY